MVSEITEDREYMECVKDILCHPVFQSMDQYIQHGTTTCKTHCIQVSYLGYKLCKQLGGNWRSAARAGLLHDLFLYDWHTHAKETGQYFHGFTHPKAALVNADRYFRGGTDDYSEAHVAPDPRTSHIQGRICSYLCG